MANIDVLDMAGQKVGDIELSDAVLALNPIQSLCIRWS